MNVVVVGMGYVGVSLAVVLASTEGFNVTGVQRNSPRSGWKIEKVNRGETPFRHPEPGLEDALRLAVAARRLRVVEGFYPVADAGAVFITVQTPIGSDHRPDYGALREVGGQVGSRMREGVLVVLESTVSPGATVSLLKPLLEAASGLHAGEGFSLAYAYERVMPGRLLHNLRRYPRIVGGYTRRCAERARDIYSLITDAEIHLTDIPTAEVSKLVENAHRDVNIAFANEAASTCEVLGVRYADVKRFVESLPDDTRDPSANPVRRLLAPGGVGGHCLPKDSYLLAEGLRPHAFVPRLILQARTVNEAIPAKISKLAGEVLKERGVPLQGSRVAVLGAAYREETDDPRNSPSIPLLSLLQSSGADTVVHDPYVEELGSLKVEHDLEKALSGADCAIVVTGHRVYREIDPSRLKKLLRTPAVVDTRGVLDPETLLRLGFSFRGFGVPARLVKPR